MPLHTFELELESKPIPSAEAKCDRMIDRTYFTCNTLDQVEFIFSTCIGSQSPPQTRPSVDPLSSTYTYKLRFDQEEHRPINLLACVSPEHPDGGSVNSCGSNNNGQHYC